MNNEVRIPRYKMLNLAWLVGITIGLSAILVVVSFGIFLNSGAYNTVKQISAAEDVLRTTKIDDLDITSPIQAMDLQEYSDSLPQKVKSLDDKEDFSQVQL